MLHIETAPWIHYDRQRGEITCDHCHATRPHKQKASFAKLTERLRAFAREHEHTGEVRS